jgi:hypothetical protein
MQTQHGRRLISGSAQTRNGRGIWDESVISEMKIAVGFEMDLREEQFLEAYTSWRRRNPLSA